MYIGTIADVSPIEIPTKNLKKNKLFMFLELTKNKVPTNIKTIAIKKVFFLPNLSAIIPANKEPKSAPRIIKLTSIDICMLDKENSSFKKSMADDTAEV
jgi:hypothetical protein